MEEIEKQTTDISEKDLLEKAEELINLNKLDKAQEILNSVKENSGRKFFVQSELYKSRKWYNEQHNLLQAACKAEPENEDYKKALSELEEFSKTKKYKKAVKKRQMGSFKERVKDGCSKGCNACCDGACAGC